MSDILIFRCDRNHNPYSTIYITYRLSLCFIVSLGRWFLTRYLFENMFSMILQFSDSFLVPFGGRWSSEKPFFFLSRIFYILIICQKNVQIWNIKWTPSDRKISKYHEPNTYDLRSTDVSFYVRSPVPTEAQNY